MIQKEKAWINQRINGETNKQKVLELALKGNEIVRPQDIVKDPYVFEFLGIPEDKPMMESDLEEALVRQIEKSGAYLC